MAYDEPWKIDLGQERERLELFGGPAIMNERVQALVTRKNLVGIAYRSN
jgi:hypothetical protein